MRALAPGQHDTALVQPALVATALATAEVLAARGVRCDVAAGHSLGELAAWALAGGATAEDAVGLAAVRGAALSAAARAAPGELWALPAGAPVPAGWVVAVQNPGETVVAGAGPPPPGARRVPTTGPWHTPALAPARAPFEATLAALPRRPLVRPLVSASGGRVVREDAEARALLVDQLAAPIDFRAVVAALLGLGVTDAVVLGPGKVLAGLLARGGPGLRVHRTDRVVDLLATAGALGRT